MIYISRKGLHQGIILNNNATGLQVHCLPFFHSFLTNSLKEIYNVAL